MKPLQKIPEGDIGNTWLLNLAVCGSGFKDNKLNSLTSVFIRKVDLAAYEYNVARHYWSLHGVRDPLRDSVAITLPAAGDHLELCVLSLRRAIRCFDRLRKSRASPQLDALLKSRIDHAVRDLVSIRNPIEHIDKEIAEGLELEEPHTLALAPDGAVAKISDTEIRLDLLHNCITLLQEVAKVLASHKVAA
jgi:hypothetical protein